ncbi:alpha/beta hydrolase [Aurantiacibacter gangjinensis]|uniref:Alpha/beta hydrolase n=1 Tax=Aurantiacibacter gangjinensis TaxID=502682 RepID=A0A0G9MRV6_9SPHN|nr:alpha/beta hydrolase [Aurantiacibacter gangjinensis]APE28138.1 carboxylesterase family protein [Aurantiacibacter gangjinensis]KLE32053.1 alpha/beta hydrolase [Aurantiacibacter gangjinensis]
MKYVLATVGVATLALGISYWISPLHTFNTLVPKDGGSAKVASDIGYGDHPRQQLDIYAPETDGDLSGAPVIVFFYGGSWNSGTRSGYDFAGRALAAEGFVTVVPDYRLVPEVRYPAFLEDAAAAIRWVRRNIAEHGGDPDRIVVVGHSAGAYNAAMMALDERWLGEDRRAIRGLVGLAGPYDFLPLDTDSTRAAFGEWPDLPETQPVSWADGGDPPALLLTGDLDTTVKPRNSRALAAALDDAGVAAEMRAYEGVDHIDIVVALARTLRGRAPVLADTVAFARRVTGEPAR